MEFTTLQVLSNMRQIVENETLVHSVYISERVDRPDLAEAGAICGGHHACAVGSLYLAAGVEPDIDGYGAASLPDANQYHDDRLLFMADKPALLEAYNTLNLVAGEYLARHNLRFPAWLDNGDLEHAFEGARLDKAVILDFIAEAERRIALNAVNL